MSLEERIPILYIRRKIEMTYQSFCGGQALFRPPYRKNQDTRKIVSERFSGEIGHTDVMSLPIVPRYVMPITSSKPQRVLDV
jgi:hypothetical protein